MKSVVSVVFFCLLGAALAADLPAEMKDMMHGVQAACLKETGVPEAVLKEVQKTWNIPSDDKFKCFIKCNLVNIGLLSSDGVFTGEAAMKQMPQEIKDLGLKKVIDACGNVRGANPCDTAYKLFLCFVDTSKEIGAVFA